MSGERQAAGARRVVVRRPKGVGRGVAMPHEVGMNTRNEIAKSMLIKQVHENRAASL